MEVAEAVEDQAAAEEVVVAAAAVVVGDVEDKKNNQYGKANHSLSSRCNKLYVAYGSLSDIESHYY